MLQTILAFPQTLTEIGLWMTFCILIITFLVALSKISIGKKIYEANVTKPLSAWMESRVVEATKPVHDKAAAFQEYVQYHLGPNGITTPVHERLKDLEKRSVIGEIRQRRFMDNIDVLIAESDPQGETTFVNLALCELMECDAEDWYGQGWRNFIDPEHLPAEVERWEATLARRGVNPFHMVVLITKETKKRITVRARAYPIMTSGELIGYVGEMHPLDPHDIDHSFSANRYPGESASQ